MLAANAEVPPMTEAAHRSSFFRQSGWLMIANVAGGALMWAVHFLSKKIPVAEYGIFGVCLAVSTCIQGMPLQMAMTHQTALALANDRRRELAGMIRFVFMGTTALWLIGAVVVVIWHRPIIQHWGLTNPSALWLTLAVVLLNSFWLPMLSGILQGRQNFLWLGWSMILNAVGRISIAALAVLLLGGYATGMMVGVVTGYIMAVIVGFWQTRDLCFGPSLPFEWRSLLWEIVPPMVGFAAFQFLFTADTMFVKAIFNDQDAGFYVSAGTLSRALMWLVMPLASVMFPRIVHSVAKAEKSDLMGLVLIGTGVLAVLGALSLCVLGPWVVKLVYKQSYIQVATQLLPWYAGAMVPLAVANVLLNNLLARSTYKIVLPLCALAVCYGLALTQFHATLVTVLKTMGAFNLLLLVICAWFTWGMKPQAQTGK
jgi:O-antigen/teichoic acid export membrane protein